MSPVRVLASVIFMAAVATAMHYRTDVPCDFSGFNPNLAVTRLISKFPKYVTFGPEGFTEIFPGFEGGRLNVSGFQRLTQYGPALPYCMNGSRFLQFELVNDDDVVMSTPWRTCSGNQGSISLRTEFSRFTVQLAVGRAGVNDVALSYQGPTVPVSTVNPYLVVDGAGDALRMVAGTLSKIFSPITLELWHNQFFSNFYAALKQALE